MSGLDEQRWAGMMLPQQMANIGSEVGRSAKWLAKGKPEMAQGAYLRALDLIDLTLKVGRLGTRGRGPFLKELCRARDYYTDAFLSGNTEELAYLDRYFGEFALIFR